MSVPRFAWLPDAAAAYLLGCWLRTLPAEATAVVLAPRALQAEARALAVAHARCTAEVWPVEPDGPLPEALNAAVVREVGPAVTLPVALDMAPMRYQNAVMPVLPTHYGRLRQLWQWGFRRVDFAGQGGGHSMAVPHLPDAFHNRHLGKRCFVVGNGPSLNNIDMGRLKGELTLGSNRCFLGYESWGFPFTYWGVYDKYQIETYHHEYEDRVPRETVKFFPVEYLPTMRVENGCPLNSVWPVGVDRAFSAAPEKTFVGFTVTYMLLQVAACMGCDPIILIGTDHRYELTRRGYSRAFRSLRRAAARRLRGGRVYETALAAHHAWRKGQHGLPRPALWSTEDAARPTHFTDRYTAGGKNQFLPPEPEEAERDFNCAQAWAQSNGRQILNATPGSALESFPKIDFNQLF